jgi:general secretion pathway protein I
MKHRNAGFSLIEVLVALTILALATGTLLGIFSTAARNAAVAMQTQKALAVAENQLALVDGIGKYRSGVAEGMYGDQYHWTVEISELVRNDAIVRSANPVLLTVNVDWQDGPRRRSLELRSVRLERSL